MNATSYSLIKVIMMAGFVVFFTRCTGDNASTEQTNPEWIQNEFMPDSNNIKHQDIAVKPPPFSEGIFPCSECHAEMVPNPHRRKLEYMHVKIDSMFDHDSKNRWCLDCHDLNNRDSLRLASGKLIGFNESQKLCGQCHGDKYRDWKVGVHGKRTGYWKGPKEYLLCVHCHNPHSPKFKPLAPMPPPVRQEDIH
ncbi:MAG: hypothetical protein GXO83_01315 [Chlorobi bacterium]|nr:hypothetical protein [Chlorobiota bacterium]